MDIWAGVCGPTLGCIEESNGGLPATDWRRSKLPPWPWCSLSPEDPERCPQTAPLSALHFFCSTFFWRKTACHCRIVVAPTSCLCFSQLWNATKSNRVGRWLLPGKGATSFEHNSRKRQLRLSRDARLCVLPLRGAHTSGLQVHTQTHTYTHTPVNPVEVQSLSRALSCTQHIQVSHEARTQKLLMVELLQNALELPHSRRHWCTQLRQQSRSR